MEELFLRFCPGIFAKRTHRKSYKSWRRFLHHFGDGRCQWCGDQLTIENSTIDHVIPLGIGGENWRVNAVLSCQPCNAERAKVTTFVCRYRQLRKRLRKVRKNGLTPWRDDHLSELNKQRRRLRSQVQGIRAIIAKYRPLELAALLSNECREQAAMAAMQEKQRRKVVAPV